METHKHIVYKSTNKHFCIKSLTKQIFTMLLFETGVINFTLSKTVERKNDSAKKLSKALLLLLFSSVELGRGNCTKPIREDIEQLDSERLWAIKCRVNMYTLYFSSVLLHPSFICTCIWCVKYSWRCGIYIHYHTFTPCLGHVDYLYPVPESENREKDQNRRWSVILQKHLNPACRHLRSKK